MFESLQFLYWYQYVNIFFFLAKSYIEFCSNFLQFVFLERRQITTGYYPYTYNPVLVLRIRIRSIRTLFLGPLDPDTDTSVRGTDPDPLILNNNNKKNLNSYCFLTLYDFLSLKNDVCRYLQKVPRSMTKIAGSGSINQRHGSADPDPNFYQNVTDPQHHRVHKG
jgi:hypothetical protein